MVFGLGVKNDPNILRLAALFLVLEINFPSGYFSLQPIYVAGVPCLVFVRVMIIGRRHRLREATRVVHSDLEATIGAIDSAVAYKRYVFGQYCFRAPLETYLETAFGLAAGVAGCELDGWGFWRPSTLTPLLLQDIEDLGSERRAVGCGLVPCVPPPSLTRRAQLFGALYVLEGSTLGARILAVNVKTFGFSEKYGARHLERQSQAIDHWRAFIDVLERQVDLDMDEAEASALEVFGFARDAFKLFQAEE